MVMTRIKSAKNENNIPQMLQSLYWRYDSEDLVLLSKLNVFNTLCYGDGSMMHPLKKAWGRILRENIIAEEAQSLTKQVLQTFEFLFKVLLKNMLSGDASLLDQENIQDNLRNANLEVAKVAMQNSQNNLKKCANNLMEQIFSVMFQNINRYMRVLDMLPLHAPYFDDGFIGVK
jgi:hypothetical protein